MLVLHPGYVDLLPLVYYPEHLLSGVVRTRTMMIFGDQVSLSVYECARILVDQ